MYRNCIFCSAVLQANDALERFPVGRRIAFDGERGRLWAVCGKCARWNLAPLEERWEAIEDAERLFRDTRLRVQSENIGVAKLRDGTRLIRVGEAVPGELAIWRYGESLVHRRRRHALVTGSAVAAVGAVYFTGLIAGGVGISAANLLVNGGSFIKTVLSERRVMGQLDADPRRRSPAHLVQWRRLRHARVEQGPGGEGLQLRIPPSHRTTLLGRVRTWADWTDLVVTGAPALRLINRAMPLVNASGARQKVLNNAVQLLEVTPPGEYIRNVTRATFPLATDRRAPVERLAFEMALNEESERRAMEGELAALEAMWREAEQIAAIADRLPDMLTEETG